MYPRFSFQAAQSQLFAGRKCSVDTPPGPRQGCRSCASACVPRWELPRLRYPSPPHNLSDLIVFLLKVLFCQLEQETLQEHRPKARTNLSSAKTSLTFRSCQNGPRFPLPEPSELPFPCSTEGTFSRVPWQRGREGNKNPKIQSWELPRRRRGKNVRASRSLIATGGRVSKGPTISRRLYRVFLGAPRDYGQSTECVAISRKKYALTPNLATSWSSQTSFHPKKCRIPCLMGRLIDLGFTFQFMFSQGPKMLTLCIGNREV